MPNRAGGSSADQFEQDLIAATSASNQRSTTTAPDPFEDDLLAATATGPRRFVVEDPGRAARDPLDGLLPGSAGFADQLARDLTAERDARRRGLPGRTIPNPVTATQGAAYTAEEMAQARAALREVDAAQGENFGNASTDRVVGDTAIDLARGVASIPNAAVRLADIGAAVTGLPQPGAALARRGIDLGAPSDALERAQSPELRAARDAANAEGGNNLFRSAGAVLKRPSVALSMAAEALPQMFAGAGLGRMVLGNTVGAALLGEAAMTSSGVADSFADASPTGEITRGQAGLALLAGGVGAVISKTGNKLATALGFDDVDTMLVGVAANPAVRTRLATRVIASGIQEGLLEEAPQSAVEQILTNAGLGQPLLQDVGTAAGQGAVVGGVMGVGAQMAGAGDHAEAQRAAEAEAQLAQEWERGRPERSAAFTAANEAYLAQFTPERAQAIRDARYAETHPTPEGVRGRDPNYGGDPIARTPPPLPHAPAQATSAPPVDTQAPPAPETPQEAPSAADEDLPPIDLAGMSEEELLAALGEQETAPKDAPAETAVPFDEELPPLDLNGLSEDDLIRAVSESPETPAEPTAPATDTPAEPGRVRRFQWMRNAEGGQERGNQQTVQPLTEDLYQRWVRPLVGGDDASVEAYQQKHPDVTHISLVTRGDGTTVLGAPAVGTEAELTAFLERRPEWVREVTSFEDADAQTQARTADSEQTTASPEPASLAPDDQEAPDGAPDNWHDVVRAARASGFTGTTRELFTAYRDITSFEEATRGADDEHGDVALMRAIAKAGGLKWDGAGETQNLWEASPDYIVPTRVMRKDFKGVLKGRRLPTGRLLGVSRVLRNDGTGLTWDGLREALAQNPQYRHLADAREADIIDLVTTAAERGKQAPPKLAASAFMKPRWWVDRMADDGSPIGDYASEWSWQALARTFGYPEDVAKAVDAIARAIFSAKELANILLQKGGTPGEGARMQPGDLERVRERWKKTRLITVKDTRLLLGDTIPEHLQAIVDFMLEQRKKTAAGELTNRDVAKAYLLTLGSIGAQAIDLDTFVAKTGMRPGADFTFTGNGKLKIRPEEAVAYWLTTPAGARALDTIERGQVDARNWQGLFTLRDAFGRNEIRNNGFKRNPAGLSIYHIDRVTAALNAAKGDPAKIGEVVRKLTGIKEGKEGFLKHLLGFGDVATVDAQEVNYWLTGKSDTRRDPSARAQLVRDVKSNLKDRPTRLMITRRIQAKVGDVATSYQLHPAIGAHIVHHWLWDKAKGSETTHAGMMKAMALAQRSTGDDTDFSFGENQWATAHGSMELLEDTGKALIRALNTPNASTAPHELIHVVRVFLLNRDIPAAQRAGITDAMIDAVEAEYGVENGAWTDDQEEAFATDFERYLQRGTAPSSTLADVFARFATWMREVYDTLLGHDLSPRMIGVFDQLLTRQDRLNAPQGGATTDVALPGLEKVRSQALGESKTGPRLATVSAQAPDDGTFRLDAERADGRTLTEREQREEAGQTSMLDDLGLSDTQKAAADELKAMLAQRKKPLAQRFSPRSTRVLYQNDDPMVKLAVTFIMEGAKKGQNLHQVWATFAAYMGEGFEDAKPVFERAGQFLYKRPVTLKANPLAEAPAPAPPKAESKTTPPGAPSAPSTTKTHEQLGNEVAGFGKYPSVKINKLLDYERGYVAYLLDLDPDRITNPRAKEVREWLRTDPAVVQAFGEAFIAGVNQTEITDEQRAALDQAGLTGEVFTQTNGDRRKLMVRLSGGAGAIDAWKSLIAEIGGKRITPGRDWQLNLRGQFAAFVARLRGAASTGIRPSNRRAAYLSDPQLRQLREDLEREDDRSGLDRDPLVRLDPATIAAIRKGEGRVPPEVLTEQLEDIARIAQAHERKTGFYLLASDPGSGKTFVLGGAIQELKRQGAKHIVYVTMSDNLIAQIRRDLSAFDLSDVEFVSYTQLRKRAEGEATDVMIFDESHNAKNDEGAQQGLAAKAWIAKTQFTIFTSATPVENPVEMKYYDATGLFDAAKGYLNWVVAFGASPVRNPDGTIRSAAWINTATAEDDAKAARQWLVKRGVYTSRPIRLPANQVATRMVPVPSDAATKQLYDDIVAAANVVPNMSMNGRMWLKNFQKRITEASKVPLAITRAKEARKAERFPVIFVETKAERSLDIPDILQRENDYLAAVDAWKLQPRDNRPPKPQRGEFGAKPEGIATMLDAYMARTGEKEILIPSAEDVIAEAFGADQVAIYTGSVSNSDAQQNLAAWRAGAKPVLVATMAKGGTGLSLHDTTGTHPTTQIVVTLPWTATSVVQVAQRTARYGMIGTAEIEWLFAEDIDFDKALAARVGTRMANMGATVHGKVSGDAEKIQGWDLDTEAAAKYTRTTAEDDETADSRGETSPRPRFSPRASRADIVATTPPPTTTATTTATPPEGMRERNTDIKKVQGLELPELVELAQTLMKTPRLVKSFRKAGKLGEFNSASGIKILATLASPENLGEVVKTLAHEIGHLIDWLPTQTLKRGNLLGRLYSLDAYLKHTIQGAHGDTVKLGEIDQELTKVSDTWRPWDRANASTEFTKYRNSSKEKYADALSMLLNDPKQFKALAPTFWREWLDGLDAKPEVQDAYESLQTLLNGTAEDLAAHRLDRAEEMFAKGDERQYDIATQRQADRERRTPSKWQQFKSHYLSRNYSAIDRVRYLRTQFKLELPDTVNPVYALEERTHLGSTQKAWVERYVDQVRAALLGAGVNWTHFGVQLMYDRILKGDRTKLGNPLGTTPASAQMTLDKMRAGYSPKQLEVLDAQVAKFRTGMREVAERGHEAGLFGPEQWKNMEENEAYAPFRVLDYMEQDMRATVRHQTGTWKDIQNPADAAILKVLVTISASAHQQAKLKMADMLLSYFRDDVVDAPRTFDLTTKRWVPKEPDNKDLRLVTYLREGQAHGIHVEPYIAEMLNRSSSLTSPLIEILGQANAVWFRPVLTTFNVGFQATNLLRDMWRTWKNMGYINLAGLLKRYWQGRGIAIARASDGKLEKSKVSRRLLGVSEQSFEQAVEQMLDAEERAILSVSFTRFMSMGDPELTQIDAILVKLGFLPPSSRTPSKAEQWARLQMLKLGQQARKAGAGSAVDLAVKGAGKTGRGVMRVLEGMQRAGDIIEALPKAAALVEEASRAGGIANIRANRRSFIRRKAGSPDFLDLGMSGGSMNKVLLFSNAVIQAWRADAEVMTDPKTRAGWWTRTAVLNILPKVLMALAIGGAFDDDEDEPQDRVSTWMRAIPFYDLLNYLVIPTGIDERGKVHYLRMPQDDFGRIITGVLWNGLANAAGRRDDSALEMARELVKYTAGQFPGPSPAITLPLDAFAAITGQNVLDTFRGKFIFTPDEMDAGGLPKAQKFLRYAYKELGGDVFYKISLDARAEAEPDSAWEVITSIPVAGNLLGRFYKTSDAGIREMGYEAMTKTRAQEARIRLKEKAAREVALDQLFKASDEARTGMRWGLARDIVEQVYADRDADERSQRTAAIVKKLDMGVLRGDSDTLTELVLSAQTNQQKAAAIAQVRTTMSDAMFRQWRQQARRVGVISDDLDDLIPAR